ncbi:flagellar hook-basal body complex protein [Candidatus Saganbacteria bacterium]|nr:flagellar hook-basal body complex protein [Candidatus Saganbacteria bacterium]
MTDRIFEIGQEGLDSADQKVRKLMDNMVGAEVPGYKKSEVIVRGFPLELAAAEQRVSAMKPQVDGTFINNAAGTLAKTGGKLDLALGGEGFFVLQGPWGEGYTRDGRFRLDKEGRLLSVAGNFPVLGNNGPIVVTQGADVTVTQTGQVMIDGVEANHLKVVKPETPGELESLNGSIFKKSNPDIIFLNVETPRIVQGYIETSNVNIMEQMVEMISLERLQSINAKLMQTRDGNLSRAMELGKATP